MRSIYAVIFLFCSMTCFAEVSSDIYMAKVPVESQGSEDREKAILQAFDQVVTKATGRQDILSTKEVQAVRKNALQLFESYRYEEGKDSSKSSWMLVVRFMPSAFQPLLKNNNPTPVHGIEFAQPILLWVDDTDNHEVISTDTDSSLKKQLESSAREKGLSLFFPEMDLDDLVSVTSDDIRTFQETTLQQASFRYHSPVVLIMHISSSSKSHPWMGQSVLIKDGAKKYNTKYGNSIEKVVDGLLDDLQRKLSLVEKEVPNILSSNAIKMTVTHLMNINDFAHLMDHLKSFKQVKQVEATEFQSNQVSLMVSMEGGAQALSSVLKNDKAFTSVANESVETSPVSKVTYEWMGGSS